VDVFPIGAISHNLEGKELAELYDMKQAGAIAFSDGNKSINDDGFMSRALQYAKGFDALLMVYPENKSIAGKSQINESRTSVLLGMKGIPALAEEMHISRDIFLAEYHNAPIHIHTISTAGSVALIKRAKRDGIRISCDVAAHHLVFTEDLLQDFDSNYKVKPPLRSKADIKALIAGLKDGTIDAVSAQHRPQEIEFKNVEFEIAAYGIIALQTALPMLVKAGLDAQQIASKLAIGPRAVLGLPAAVIRENEDANFTVFNLQQEWVYNATSNYSKSSNSPLLNQTLKGKVNLVYNNRQYKVQSALVAALDKFAEKAGQDASVLKQALFTVFDGEAGFLEKVDAFDAAFDDYPVFDPLREVLFDLLMINFFAVDVQVLEDDYLESEEWEKIEDDTIDRGTELLNLLMYINECHTEGIKPALDDFLKEFLLVEEDEFQDEFEIYEDLISNQQLVESSIEDICSHAAMIDLGEEMEDLFVPFMVFFHQPKATEEALKELEAFSGNAEFDLAVYSLVSTFNANK
jgi:dihydroorotase